MKFVVKNLLRLNLICVFILLSACDAEKDLPYQSKIKVKRFSMKDNPLRIDPMLIDAVNKVKSLKSNVIDANSKIVFDEKSGLYFDDEKGVYIEQGDKASYTFPVIRLSSLEKVQNICFDLKPDGNYDVFLVKYDFTKEQAAAMNEEQLRNSQKEFIKLITDGDVVNLFRYMCIDVVVYVTHEVNAPINEGNNDGGGIGNNNSTVVIPVVIASGCFFTTETTNTSGSNNSDGNSENPGAESNPTGTYNGGGTIITGSLFDDTEAQNPDDMPLGWKLEFFRNSLDESTELPIYYQFSGLEDVLAANNCDFKSQQFVREKIGELLNGETELDLSTFDEQIDPSNLPQCIKEVLEDIQTLETAKLSDIINLFKSKNPIALDYNWMIRKGPLANNNPAHTRSTPINNNILTTLNETYLPLSSELSVAKTLMHEAFHAYLVAIFENRNIDLGYANLLNEYAKLFNENEVNDLHHYFFIKQNIVDEIAKGLKEYGTLKGYNLSDQYYEDMAWAGLLDTSAFDHLPDDEKERIMYRIEAEFTSNGSNGYSPETPKACP